jgi:acyl-CoA thioesterase FadM
METYRAWQDGPTFHWETVLGFRDCDEQKQQRLSSLLDLLVEASGRDYALRGFPHERMVALRQVFLLSRLRLRIVRPLRHPERAEVVTWEDGTVGARVRREYELRDGQGALCCAARSEWLLADPVDHRLLRPHFNGCEIPAVNRRPTARTATSCRITRRGWRRWRRAWCAARSSTATATFTAPATAIC